MKGNKKGTEKGWRNGTSLFSATTFLMVKGEDNDNDRDGIEKYGPNKRRRKVCKIFILVLFFETPRWLDILSDDFLNYKNNVTYIVRIE